MLRRTATAALCGGLLLSTAPAWGQNTSPAAPVPPGAQATEAPGKPVPESQTPPRPPELVPTDAPVVEPEGVRGSFIFFIAAEAKDEPQPGWDAIPVLAQAPPKNLREIGIIEVVGFGEQLALAQLLPEVKRQASRMGAKAVHKVQTSRFTTSGEALYVTAIALGAR